MSNIIARMDLDTTYIAKATYIQNILSKDNNAIRELALILKEYEKVKEHENEINLIILQKDNEREKAILQKDNEQLKELMSLEKENLIKVMEMEKQQVKELLLKEMAVLDNYYKSKISVLAQR